MTTLRGPADPDAFRVQVGRYGERWYHDPLPACELAEATDDAWPSATTVKKAWPKFLTSWAATEAAVYAVDHQDKWLKLDRDDAVKVIAGASNRTRDKAGARGTKIHEHLEGIANGVDPDSVVDHDVAPWVDAMKAVISEVNPTWVLTEAVAISRTHGVAGTLDAVWEIDGKLYLVDFKTRGAGKVGAAYDDEGIQLGLYDLADYIIIERDGKAVRVPPPALDGGLIITIAPEGYRLFPVDMTAARNGAKVLKAFWQVQANKDIIGKPKPLANKVDPLAEAKRLQRVTWLISCMQAINKAGKLDALAQRWPLGVDTFKTHQNHNHAELDAIKDAVDFVGSLYGLPFFKPDPAAATVAAPRELDKARTAKMRNDFGDDDLFVGLVRVACLSEGRPLSQFNHDDVERLAALLGGIEEGLVSVSFDEKGDPKVTGSVTDLLLAAAITAA